jgi:FkbM family methyltransferase
MLAFNNRTAVKLKQDGKHVFRHSMRFIYDTAILGTSKYAMRQKLSIWRDFARLSLGFPRRGANAAVAGFQISYFDQSTLAFLFREIFVRQVYRLQMNNPEPFILDCGANLGMASLFFKYLYPNCRLKCFEPDPATFSLLQRNICDNRLRGIETFNIALWDENSSVELFRDPASQGALLMSTSAARMRGPAITVPARKLSEFIDCEVDFLKLDVEGAELRIMRELSDSGKLQSVREMAVEYHHRLPGEPSAMSAFLGIMEENGFEYQIAAGGFPDPTARRIQDVMIYAWHSTSERHSS